jgi:hypothetical protein
MDKLKKYARYAGLGILGGFIVGFIGLYLVPIVLVVLRTVLDSSWVFGNYFNFGPITILVSILGGCLGGVISKERGGAFLGGFILIGLYWFAIFLFINAGL